MRKPVAVVVSLLAATCLCGSMFAAGSRTLPSRYLPGTLDHGLSVLRGADGATMAVWAYNSGAEYDIAFSRADAGGRWTEPTFIGAGDGIDQLEPALAADADGNLFVAYTDTARGVIRLGMLKPDGSLVAEPLVVRARSSRAFSASQLTVVGERVIVAFRDAERTRMIDLPRTILVQGGALLTITESGDPVEYRPGTDAPTVEGPSRLDPSVDERPVEVAPNIPKKRYMDKF